MPTSLWLMKATIHVCERVEDRNANELTSLDSGDGMIRIYPVSKPLLWSPILFVPRWDTSYSESYRSHDIAVIMS